MTDTPDHVETHFRRLLAARTPAERLRMCTGMFAAAKALAAAGIRAKLGRVSERELRRQLFIRFYGGQYTEAERQVILDVADSKLRLE